VTAATDPEAQRTYRQLAQQWREMATHFEAKEQRIPTLRQGVASGIGVGEPND
jgi:NAD dependent epimerase/dehydratase family enzyme